MDTERLICTCRPAGTDTEFAEGDLVEGLQTAPETSVEIDNTVEPAEAVNSTTSTPGDVLFSEPEPWPSFVDGWNLFRSLHERLLRYMVMSDDQAKIVVLWVFFAHLHDTFEFSPCLAITSPEKGSGKTTLMDLVSELVLKALATSSITPASLFRVVEAYRPTLLIDEADTFLGGNTELVGILNSGWRRTAAKAVRTGKKQDGSYGIEGYSTWAPKVIALNGALPETLHDRSIKIQVRRKKVDEHIERFDLRKRKELVDLKRKLIRWTMDHEDLVQGVDVEMPAALGARQAENWRPLLTIAKVIGDDLFEQAALAAVQFEEEQKGRNDVEGLGTRVLRDSRTVFAQPEREFLPTEELVGSLRGLPESPWATDVNNGRGLNSYTLAKMLRPYGVSSTRKRTNGVQLRGYARQHFEEAWERYLPSTKADEEAQPVESSSPVRRPRLKRVSAEQSRRWAKHLEDQDNWGGDEQ